MDLTCCSQHQKHYGLSTCIAPAPAPLLPPALPKGTKGGLRPACWMADCMLLLPVSHMRCSVPAASTCTSSCTLLLLSPLQLLLLLTSCTSAGMPAASMMAAGPAACLDMLYSANPADSCASA